MSSLDDYSYQVGYERAITLMFRAQVEVLCNLIRHYPHLWTYGDGYGGWAQQVLQESFDEYGFPRQEHERRAPNGRRAFSRKKLLAVYQKSNGLCVACKQSENLEVDHIVPLSRGGSNDLENLQLLCATCNRSKGTKTMEEWSGDAA